LLEVQHAAENIVLISDMLIRKYRTRRTREISVRSATIKDILCKWQVRFTGKKTTATLVRHQEEDKDIFKICGKSVFYVFLINIADSTRHTTANVKIYVADSYINR
jgi:hypothetical protein